MSNRLNRFVSLSALALIAGCHSTPTQPALAQKTVQAASPSNPAASNTAAPASAAAGAAGAPGAAPSNTAAVPAADATPIPPRAAQQFSQALQLMKSGRNTDAELEFQQLSAAYPQFAGPQLNLGLLYLHDAKLADAQTAFQAALKVTPNNPVAADELGIVERKLGKFTEAETAYLSAIAADPNYASAHLNLGVLYDLYLAEPQKALEQYERYVELVGENKQIAGWVIEVRKRAGAAAPAAKKDQST